MLDELTETLKKASYEDIREICLFLGYNENDIKTKYFSSAYRINFENFLLYCKPNEQVSVLIKILYLFYPFLKTSEVANGVFSSATTKEIIDKYFSYIDEYSYKKNYNLISLEINIEAKYIFECFESNKKFIEKVEEWIRWYAKNPINKFKGVFGNEFSYFDILKKVLSNLKINTKDLKDCVQAEDLIIDFINKRVSEQTKDKSEEEIKKMMLSIAEKESKNSNTLDTAISGIGTTSGIIVTGQVTNTIVSSVNTAQAAFNVASTALNAADTAKSTLGIYQTALNFSEGLSFGSNIAACIPSLTSQTTAYVGSALGEIGTTIAQQGVTQTGKYIAQQEVLAATNYVAGKTAMQTASKFVAIRTGLSVLNAVGTAYFIGSGIWWLFSENYKKLVPAVFIIVQLRMEQRFQKELELV